MTDRDAGYVEQFRMLHDHVILAPGCA
jgi:hypothetical protein